MEAGVEEGVGRALIFITPMLAEDEDMKEMIDDPSERERLANLEKEELEKDYASLRKSLRDRSFIIGFEGSQEEEEAKWEEIREKTTNLSRTETLEKLKELSEDKDSDCILVAWLGQGYRSEQDGHSRERIRVKGGELMYVDEIWKPFLSCEKPKIFLINSCRGRKVNAFNDLIIVYMYSI